LLSGFHGAVRTGRGVYGAPSDVVGRLGVLGALLLALFLALDDGFDELVVLDVLAAALAAAAGAVPEPSPSMGASGMITRSRKEY
jgi:hypothetical protein